MFKSTGEGEHSGARNVRIERVRVAEERQCSKVNHQQTHGGDQSEHSHQHYL